MGECQGKPPLCLALTVIRNEFKLTTVGWRIRCAEVTNAKMTSRFLKKREVDLFAVYWRGTGEICRIRLCSSKKEICNKSWSWQFPLAVFLFFTLCRWLWRTARILASNFSVLNGFVPADTRQKLSGGAANNRSYFVPRGFAAAKLALSLRRKAACRSKNLQAAF